MAIDNSLYDSLENTYTQIKNYLDSNRLGPEHSQMIIKHEELAELLERLDIEAIEEQSNDIHALHDELNEIKTISSKLQEELNIPNDSSTTATNTADKLDEIFSKINKVIV